MSDSIIQHALEAGFMLSTAHGENKLMPVSDSATLRKFAELVTAEVRGERDLALKTVDRFAETITSQKQRLAVVERELENTRRGIDEYNAMQDAITRLQNSDAPK